MISKRKEYLIQLFMKRCTLQSINKAHINFSFQLFSNTYDIPPKKLNELREKYTLGKYIERITPLVDEQFSEEELKEAIKFFSSSVGKKMLDRQFLHRVGEIGTKMFAEIEQKFAIYNKENRNESKST